MSPGQKKILWIDDEIEFLRSHIMFLEEHNYEVSKANNGDDGLHLVREKTFDLIFLDEQMPGMDGLTTLEEIKSINPEIPVVMVTKSEEEQLMEEAFGRNIDSYLTKPVNPSQILAACKKILHSTTIKKTHITSEYVRKYANYKAKIMTQQNPITWENIYKEICEWDRDIQTIKDQGLGDTHLNQKQELSKKFIHFMESNYLQWNSPRGNNHHMITNTFKNEVFPLLKKNKKVCTVIITGFRVDQWMMIKSFLTAYFRIQENIGWALLPTDKKYCRTGLFAGKNTNKISQDHPELWNKLSSEENMMPYELELLKYNLFSNGLQTIDNPKLQYIRSKSDSLECLNNIKDYENDPLVTFVVEFSELLGTLRQESPLLMEIAPDAEGIKELTRLWFQSSNLLRILIEFGRSGRHVILTSDHGAVLVDKPVEVFCQEEKTPNPRMKKGMDISCDERHVHFIESPEPYGLPAEERGVGYALAKENFYFTYPNKYQYFGSKFKGQIVSGGLSMEEVLVPLISLHPIDS